VYTYFYEEMVRLTKRQSKQYRRQYYLANQKDALLQKKEDYKQNVDARRKANQLAYELKSKQRKLAQKKHYSLNADKVKYMMKLKYLALGPQTKPEILE